MKFNINSKDFKELTEKAITCVNKKAKIADLTKIYLNIAEDRKLEVKTSNLEHYLILECDNIFNSEPGFCTIDCEDLKAIHKLSGVLTVAKEENKLIFNNGKKTLFISCYDTYDISFPVLKEEETKYIMSVHESWMMETLTKLDIFTPHEYKNIAMECFNFNTAKNRIEALDGYRIGIRTFPDSCKLGEERQETEYLLLNTCIPMFKKVLDKKSNNSIEFYTNGKYNKFCGTNFTYYSKCVNTHYYKVENMLYTQNYNQSCFVKLENLMGIAKYNKDLANLKKEKKHMVHMVLKCKNNTLYSYMKTSRYETLDSIKTHNLNIKEGFGIAFNPHIFLKD